ncbi:16S rRNA (cytidine(1402)-2'-O)-methyltransferase [Paralimibaculum aggregatum]|uniref:Ribosomal RNA small subunit methyltransferase I n=1 Tax=Paralimibaculum aggregatum TaxID=3036245 RepID=A0ABQ6LQZ7_9RHOB|nr:16S rRNA (cytidine(1402)-2'-O)-methyltransferase [Limibaculum sp. NKW23]
MAPAGAPVAAGSLAPGLYLVATPIGNAADISLRALDILARAEVLAAEDTRRTRKLMQIHGIALGERPIVSYHDQNGPARRPQIMGWLAEGRSVAYCSDAGTPLVADPGYRLAEAALAAGHGLTAVPGASAVLAALSVSGLPSDRFLFAGFLPPKAGARRAALAELAAVPATLVFYESPRRLGAALAEMAEVLGARPAAVARELTKLHEEVVRGALPDLAARYAAADPRGEIVVVIGPPDRAAQAAEAALSLDGALAEAMAHASLKDAVKQTAERLGLPRKQVYARALELGRED